MRMPSTRQTHTVKAEKSIPSGSTLNRGLAPSFYDSTLGFVLYAIAMIGCLGTITALIEKAAP